MLTEKCRNQEAMIEEFELREQEYQEMMSETESVKQQNDSMKYVLYMYFTTHDPHSKKTNNMAFYLLAAKTQTSLGISPV